MLGVGGGNLLFPGGEGGIWRRVGEIIRGSLILTSMPSVLFYSPITNPNNLNDN